MIKDFALIKFFEQHEEDFVAKSVGDVIRFMCLDYLRELRKEYDGIFSALELQPVGGAPRYHSQQEFGLSVLSMAYQTYKINAQNTIEFIDWVENDGSFPLSYKECFGDVVAKKHVLKTKEKEDRAWVRAYKERKLAEEQGEDVFADWKNAQIKKVLSSPIFQQIMYKKVDRLYERQKNEIEFHSRRVKAGVSTSRTWQGSIRNLEQISNLPSKVMLIDKYLEEDSCHPELREIAIGMTQMLTSANAPSFLMPKQSSHRELESNTPAVSPTTIA
ncbi:MAG: hypothetical protein FWC00_06550 [Firmicutes bacterium]|nr:hypothetical protein [Bacillota bacterium]